MKDNFIIYNGCNKSLHTPPPPEILSSKSIDSSKYIQLQQIQFIENNNIKTWDIANSHNSVAIIIYDYIKNGFIFVRQFRVSVFLRNPKHGYMYELCAGLCDKDNKNIEEIALQELEEECGYRVSSERIQQIAQFYNSVGMNGAIQYLFFTKVSQKDRISEGGGNKDENENIDLIFVPENLIFEFLNDNNCPKSQSLAYSILWYKQNALFNP